MSDIARLLEHANELKDELYKEVKNGVIEKDVMISINDIIDTLNGVQDNECLSTKEYEQVQDFEDFVFEKRFDGYVLVKYIGFEPYKLIIPSVYKGEHVVGIAENLFSGLSTLTEVEISKGISFIGARAFASCQHLKTVKMNTGLYAINDQAFEECAIQELVIPDSVIYIGASAFANNDIMSLKLSANLRYIDSHAFSGCSHLKKVDIPEHVISISDRAFSQCTNLNSIALNYGLKQIGTCCFMNCKSLKSVDIPDSVEYIGENAFAIEKKWQPDLRYNVRIYYENSDICIACKGGSVAYDYARQNKFKMKKSGKQYNKEHVIKPKPYRIIIYGLLDFGTEPLDNYYAFAENLSKHGIPAICLTTHEDELWADVSKKIIVQSDIDDITEFEQFKADDSIYDDISFHDF